MGEGTQGVSGCSEQQGPRGEGGNAPIRKPMDSSAIMLPIVYREAKPV